ncbi:phytanoyl-CoA dioxygenase family protein [Niabella pedocola]|uniref:Phytanoyl-CoA dioxygenase family protein n=1 Tax=Niabella pedocola TaxID=1752077 RepID=A0ABS8PXX2_9BACT|nr:phytanoyl-CoA dioxygenase family protein [Niabella pedocola]MCD2424776.1 phytanoyl-CoA dioxygenase family protein [Niabella pedocola]
MNSITKEVFDMGYTAIDALFPKRQISNLECELFNLSVFDFQCASANLLCYSSVAGMASDPLVMDLVKSLSGTELFPVRALVLDKTKEMNWQLPWHQDLKIAVQQKTNAAGYTNWSLEADVWHVQPPVQVLERLITIRIHFDSCTEENGAMHIIPGSHRKGILSSEQISKITESVEHKTVSMKSNGIMLMRPLLLHDSPASCSNIRRRILQIEYGFDLNNGINWL